MYDEGPLAPVNQNFGNLRLWYRQQDPDERPLKRTSPINRTRNYWWPGLRTFVKNYVQLEGCGICQQFKIDRTPSKPAYIPTEGATSTRPFANCSMDLITDLPQVVMFKARPEALSRARPCQGSRAAEKPWMRAWTAHGSGFLFSKPWAAAPLSAWVAGWLAKLYRL